MNRAYDKASNRSINPLRSMARISVLKVPGSAYLALFEPLQDIQSRVILICGIVLAIAAGVPLPVIGVIFGKIINAFPPPEDEILTRVYQLIGVACAYFVVTWGWALCWGIIGARISRNLRIRMVERALGMDQTYYETNSFEITNLLTADAQTVQAGTAEKVGLFIQSCSYFCAALIVGFILNAQLTAIVFAVVAPPMAIAVYAGTSIVSNLDKEVTAFTASAASIAESSLKAVQVVQAFDAFEALTSDHKVQLARAFRVGVKKAIAGAVLLGSVFFVAYAANALAFWQGSRIVRDSLAGKAGTVYAIVFLILDASFVIGQAGPFIQSFSQAASAGRRIFALINHPEIPIDVYSEGGICANEATFAPRKDIVFKDVSFAYPARPDETVLKSVTFGIKAGTSVGIVGASGSGKSTIAALLLRLYDPSTGHATIDGHNLNDFNLASLRSQIAVVDQDPVVFSGTIFSNIRDGYRGPELPDDELRNLGIKAAKEADAWAFINLLPNGLNTQLGEPGGIKLSGGQKQRLCLARALMGDAPLLVMDEATSALDNISEASILKKLGKSRSLGNRTTVMIAHRLASVRSADNIIVMGEGRVLEQGDHDSLVSLNGAYQKLVDAQRLSSGETSNFTEPVDSELDTESASRTSTRCSAGAVTPVRSLDTRSFGTVSIVKRCLALSRAKVFYTCLALFGSLLTGGLIIGESIIFGNLVHLLNGSPLESRVDLFCLMFFVLALVALAGQTTSGSCFGVSSEELIARSRDISLRTILRQDMEWFLQPGRSTAALASVISMDAGHLRGFSGVIIGTIMSAIVSVVGGAILAHIVAWKIAIVLFATSPIVVLAGYLRLRVLAKVEQKNQEAYIEAATIAIEACSNIRTIASLCTEKVTAERFRLAVGKYGKHTFRQTALGNIILAFSLSITYFIYALAYWWGSKQVRAGKYTSLQFFIVLPAILFSAQGAGQIFSLAPDIGRAKGAASRVFALHDQKPTIDNPANNFSHSNDSLSTLVAPGDSHNEYGTIMFQNVHFAYKSRAGHPIFTDLSFTIYSGETVALVGRSGAGKTSIISLVERFYDPTSGVVLIDGVDIRKVSVAQHRSRISLVSQDPDLFSGSVAFNVGLGARPGHVATKSEIVEACKAVGIHEFIEGLPDGYETQCGNNGSQLSGGQKQRVAIARAYIRDPDVLLLDEATSALDLHSEAQIQKAIARASRKRTTIMIAHRLTSVQNVDRIIVFDKGRIVEQGRHEVLMNSGGIYEQMVRAGGL